MDCTGLGEYPNSHPQHALKLRDLGYRNPSSARICASFPQLQRPQTVGGGYSRQQLQQQLQLRKVARTEPRTTPALPPDTPQSNDTGIMMTSLTDALSRGRNITSSHFDSVCFEKDMFYKDQDTRSSISHPINTPCSAVDGGAGSEYRPTPRDDPASAGSAAQISKERLSMTNEASEEEASVVAPLLSEMKAAAEKSAATEDDAGGAPVGIMIGLEDEAGSAAPVEIDEADENMRAEEETPLPIEPKVPANRGRRVSITERVLKSKNSEMQLASIKFSAQCRKQQLADLLDEHAQLVTQVSEMEVDRSSSQGKENAAQH
ncbi:hypothetical protein CAPTEDRAFT_220712 [Capitella teleta]|uniref:Uncharacterized protein n=1 Tax=Capitella teleta TaxID=283909 RepID=R7UGH6_CAPTE|nr:hypothetical protein CAPTEDRAFT_220712 [Capitella teleta]|eukprot:ELU02888.1 hypothetical protein CAPTEDRAFT_220712 [Capitella teleta]